MSAPSGTTAASTSEESGNGGNGGESDTDGDATGGTEGLLSCEESGCDPGSVCAAGVCVLCAGAVAFDEDGAEIAIAETIVAARVTIDLTIDGSAPVASAYGSAEVFLEGGPLGDRVALGKTGAPLTALALGGDYQVVYEAGSVASAMPQNRRFVLGGVSVGAVDASIEASITTMRLKGSVEIDGEPPIASAYDTAEVLLFDANSGGATPLIDTQKSDGSFDLRVARDALVSGGGLVKAEYEAMYRSVKPGPKLPRNHDVLLGAKVAGQGADVTVHELAVEVETVAVSGSISVDGAAPPVSAYDSAAIFLVDTENLDRIEIGETVNGALDSFTLIKGRSYGLYYAGPKDGLIMPRDEWTMLQLVAEDPTVIDVAIEGAQVEATLTLDDAPPPSSPLNKGALALQYPGSRAPLGAVVDGVATGRVIRSDAVKGVEGLALVYSHESTDGGLPANTRAALASTSGGEDQIIALAADMRSTVLSGVILIGGEPGPVSAYDSGRVFLRGVDGDQVLLGLTREPSFSRRVLHGTYDVCYAVESAGASAPRNGDVCFDSLTVDASTSELKIDVPRVMVSISGAQRFGGGPLDRGQIYLRHLISGDEIFVGTTDQPVLAAPVVPGPYWLVYRVEQATKDAPRNQNALLSCHDLSIEWR
jgi:hypothetical protein